VRILNDEEIATAKNPKMLHVSIKNYAPWVTEEDREIIKAQHKQDIAGFIEYLEAIEFYDDWGGESGKICRDMIVNDLKQLVEE